MTKINRPRYFKAVTCYNFCDSGFCQKHQKTCQNFTLPAQLLPFCWRCFTQLDQVRVIKLTSDQVACWGGG